MMATSMTQKLAGALSLTSPEQGEFRVLVSLSSLRAGMACMLDRVHRIGETAELCTRNRVQVVQVEEAMRRQREAQHLSRVRGGILRILCRGHQSSPVEVRDCLGRTKMRKKNGTGRIDEVG